MRGYCETGRSAQLKDRDNLFDVKDKVRVGACDDNGEIQEEEKRVGGDVGDDSSEAK